MLCIFLTPKNLSNPSKILRIFGGTNLRFVSFDLTHQNRKFSGAIKTYGFDASKTEFSNASIFEVEKTCNIFEPQNQRFWRILRDFWRVF